MAYKWAEMTPLERDALVAEKVMGYKFVRFADVIVCYTGENYFADDTERKVFSPSTNISSAWEVASRWKGFLEIRKWGDGEWECMLLDEEHDPVCNRFADTAPEAICLAALCAVGVDIE